MALPNVAPILKTHVVELKLDWDRQPGAKDVERRYEAKEQGLPWFAFLDPAGDAIVTSSTNQSNLGCPWSPEEIAAFRTMLGSPRLHFSADEVDVLIKALEDFKAKQESGG